MRMYALATVTESRRVECISFRGCSISSSISGAAIGAVKHQGLTHQLLDFLLYAEASGRICVLHLRDDAKISPRLRAMIDSGRIRLNLLGHFFTAKGQSAFKAALMPKIWEAMRSMYGGNSEDGKKG